MPDDTPDKDADVVTDESAKYEAMTEAVRATAQRIADRVKPLTDEIEIVSPDAPPG